MTAPELSAQEREASYLRLDNGTTWPDPRDPNDVQWKLRYGNPDQTDLLVAAAMMHAYAELIAATGKRRDDAIRRIRAAALTDGTPR